MILGRSVIKHCGFFYAALGISFGIEGLNKLLIDSRYPDFTNYP